MKPSDYAILVSAIFIAPHLNVVIAIIVGVLLFGIGVYAATKDI